MPRDYELEEYYNEQIRAFRIWMQQQGYTETTRKEYMREVINYLKAIRGIPVNEASKLNIIEFLYLKQERAGDKARNRTLSAIRSFYTALIDFEMAKSNPALDVKKSRTEKNKSPVYLEEEDLKELIDFIDGRYRNRNITIFLLMGYCGLRVGEVHRLDLKNFNKSRGTISIFGKGRKWNEIPVPEVLIGFLDKVEQDRITPYNKKEGAFFVSQKGRRLSIRQIQKIASQMFQLFKEQRPELAEMNLSCHKLRHTFATMLLKNGVDIRVVKELLGHSSIETTMIYTHVNDDQKKQAMATVNIRVPIVS